MSLDTQLIDRLDAVPLHEVCAYFGLSPVQATKKAAVQGLPVPAFKIGSQKSPWLVKIGDLASHLERCHKEAKRDHDAINEK